MAELKINPSLVPRGEFVLQGAYDENDCLLTARPVRADPSYPKSLVRCIADAVGALDAIPKGITVTRRVLPFSVP